MPRSLDQLPLRAALVEIARDFHTRGWMAGTAGNLSARDDEKSYWITASGCPKGRLEQNDFLLVEIESGTVIEQAAPGLKPSAETAIHRVIYQRFPAARACLHVHSVDACLAAERAPPAAASLPLPALEMLKGLGVWEQSPKVNLPLFENTLDVNKIAEAIKQRFAPDDAQGRASVAGGRMPGATPPQVPALLVRGHGVTVWGGSLQEAYNRVECLEFIMSHLARCK
ncbi:MAG: methylthioribulose 1-phosphate dehydratase [Gammaproteobacteria bacterium]|nr:methylthioribulose 1-phosphate dehydratase [Gammaproteobacteria bacterium]